MARTTAELLAEAYAHYDAARWEEAGAALERALSGVAPGSVAGQDMALAWFRFGNVREEQGRDDEALACFERAVALDARQGPAWNNLGGARQRLGRTEEALDAYRRAMQAQPDLLQPYLNLGRLLEEGGRLAEAAACFRAGLLHHPGHPMLAHLAAASGGERSERASAGYVSALFDEFAPNFDKHLVERLGYRVPWLLAERVAGRLSPGSRVLDLGCGTGLVGAALAPTGCELTGVDLAPRMLEAARRRGVYRHLQLADVQQAIDAATPGAFAAVLAADVFIYVGELSQVFAGVARALEPRGLFAFSVETLEDGDYALRSTGRYAQSLPYLRRLAEASGFAEKGVDPVGIRGAQDALVPGRLLVLERL